MEKGLHVGVEFISAVVSETGASTRKIVKLSLACV